MKYIILISSDSNGIEIDRIRTKWKDCEAGFSNVTHCVSVVNQQDYHVSTGVSASMCLCTCFCNAYGSSIHFRKISCSNEENQNKVNLGFDKLYLVLVFVDVQQTD